MEDLPCEIITPFEPVQFKFHLDVSMLPNVVLLVPEEEHLPMG